MKARKCPKCNGKIIAYVENWEANGIRFEVDASGSPIIPGFYIEGWPKSVSAECINGHSWKLRNMGMIDDLLEEPS